MNTDRRRQKQWTYCSLWAIPVKRCVGRSIRRLVVMWTYEKYVINHVFLPQSRASTRPIKHEQELELPFEFEIELWRPRIPGGSVHTVRRVERSCRDLQLHDFRCVFSSNPRPIPSAAHVGPYTAGQVLERKQRGFCNCRHSGRGRVMPSVVQASGL